MADIIRISDWPTLYDTLMIVAFSGWNDAADSATTAVRYLGERLPVEPFATIDPEDFYVFTDTRPLTRIKEGTEGQRELVWPTNQFSYIAEFGGQNRSLITLTGVEPDLKWRGFGDVFMEVCQRCNVTEVVFVGALLAPVPHTRPAPITANSTDTVTDERLKEFGTHTSRYEGPTGILGVPESAGARGRT